MLQQFTCKIFIKYSRFRKEFRWAVWQRQLCPGPTNNVLVKKNKTQMNNSRACVSGEEGKEYISGDRQL